jgi:hypothetical protein
MLRLGGDEAKRFATEVTENTEGKTEKCLVLPSVFSVTSVANLLN